MSNVIEEEKNINEYNQENFEKNNNGENIENVTNNNQNEENNLSSDDEDEIISNYSYEEYSINNENKNDSMSLQKMEEEKINSNTNNNNNENVNTNNNNNNLDVLTNKSIGKSQNIEEITETNKNPDKTIFSKMTEDMYFNLINNKNYNEIKNNNLYNYDDFTNDQFLASYSQKINNNNNNIAIKNFLERNKFYNEEYKFNKETANNRLDQINEFKNNKIKLKDSNYEERIKKFNETQNLYKQKKENKLKEIEASINQSINNNIYNKPKINKKNLDYFKNKKTIKLNSNQQKKLDEKIKKELKDKKKNSNKKKIKLNNNEINNLCNKLHKDAEQRKFKKSNSESNYLLKTKIPNNYLPSKNSNSIFLNKLINEYENEIKYYLQVDSIKQNPNINIIQFQNIFEKLHFISQTENENNNKILIDNIFNELIKYSQQNQNNNENNNDNNPNQNTIESNVLLLFCLCICGFYKEKFKKTNEKKLNFINFENYKKLLNKSDFYESKYIDLNENRKNCYLQKKQENKEQKLLQQQYQEALSTNSNKSRANSSSLRTSKSVNRLKLSKSYNLILQERENKNAKLRSENLEKELKECTFKPQLNNNPKSLKNLLKKNSDEIYKKSRNNNNNINNEKDLKKLNSQERELENCSFHPNLTSLNKKIFDNNPLNNDIGVKKEINRIQNARNEQEMKLKDKSNFIQKNMIFENEKKTKYDTFDKFKKINKREPLLTFEIKIRNKYEILDYYEGEDIEKVAELFVKKNNLTKESKKQIIEAIQSKLK